MHSPNSKKIKSNCWSTIGVWGSSTEKCVELEKYIHCRNCPIFSDIGRSVFEKKAPSGYLTQWRNEISKPKEIVKKSVESILVFRSGSEWFGIQANILSEIADFRPIHRIPRNKNMAISGIVNISGVIKLCYSLSEILGISPISSSVENRRKISKRLVVFEVEQQDYVFLVDEIKGLHWYSAPELQPLPSTISENSAQMMLGSILHDKKNIAVFNVEVLHRVLERVSL